MDRIDLLGIFIRVAESGSFTHAAETLRIPRSTVSTAVQELERRLGTRLFARTTRSVALTEDGRGFQQQARRLLADFEDAENSFRLHRAQVRGRVKINLPARIGRLIVAPALPEFLDAHPGLDIELGMTDRSVNLIEDGTDCVVRVGPLQDSSLIGRRLGEFPILNVASRGYLRRHGTPQTPDDLPRHFGVLYASPSSGHIEDWDWEHDGATGSIRMPGRVTVNNADGAMACCLAGLGLAQLPAYDVRPHLISGDLVEILPRWRTAPLPVTLLSPHRQHPPRRLEVVIDWLTTLLHRHCFEEPPS